MKAENKDRSGFAGTQIYRENYFFSEIKRDKIIYGNQEFVVPWQMKKTKESENLVK